MGKKEHKKYSIVGYGCLIGGSFLLLNIEKERKNFLEEEKKKYNWDKI
ncbi:hypothetical protein ACER0A_000690 [Haloimpatiens sp. FM7315]